MSWCVVQTSHAIFRTKKIFNDKMSYLRSNPHFSVVNTQSEITVQSKEQQICQFSVSIFGHSTYKPIKRLASTYESHFSSFVVTMATFLDSNATFQH